MAALKDKSRMRSIDYTFAVMNLAACVTVCQTLVNSSSKKSLHYYYIFFYKQHHKVRSIQDSFICIKA